MARKTKKWVGALELALRIGLPNAQTLEYDNLYAILEYNGYHYNSDVELWVEPPSGKIAENPRVTIRVTAPTNYIEDEGRALRVLLELADYEIYRVSSPKEFRDNPKLAGIYIDCRRTDGNDLHEEK